MLAAHYGLAAPYGFCTAGSKSNRVQHVLDCFAVVARAYAHMPGSQQKIMMHSSARQECQCVSKRTGAAAC